MKYSMLASCQTSKAEVQLDVCRDSVDQAARREGQTSCQRVSYSVKSTCIGRERVGPGDFTKFLANTTSKKLILSKAKWSGEIRHECLSHKALKLPWQSYQIAWIAAALKKAEGGRASRLCPAGWLFGPKNQPATKLLGKNHNHNHRLVVLLVDLT
jgi:hypothetical protein